MTTENEINQEDLIALSRNPSLEVKSSTVEKVAEYYSNSRLTDKGLKLAEDIFRIIVEDVEVKVREILSNSLKKSKNIPRDIIEKIISDKNSVAVPFIKHYEQLDAQDLIKIIDSQNPEKQKAVAIRKDIPEEISEIIVQKCPEEIVGVLISNDTAKIFEKTYDSIINKYSNSENIKQRLVYRSELPVTVIEKIVNFLSEELKKRLVLTHNLPNNLATNLIEEVKEKATLQISENYSSDSQIRELVHQLYTSNRLTASLVVRAVCMGDLRFFEYSLVYLAKTPINEVSHVLFDTDADFMVRNLLRKAEIPTNMFPAVFSALNVIKDIRFDYVTNDHANFSHKVIERILSYESASEDMSKEDINYLISKID